MIKELQVPVLLNIATCLSKMKKHENAIDICGKVKFLIKFIKYQAIVLDPGNCKAYCKRAISYMECNLFDYSKDDFVSAMNVAKVNKNIHKI